MNKLYQSMSNTFIFGGPINKLYRSVSNKLFLEVCPQILLKARPTDLFLGGCSIKF